jgi:alpha 1,2-mannosyltransferase
MQTALANSTVEFGVVPEEHWNQPDWIDEDKATRARSRLVAARVKYGGKCQCDWSIPPTLLA